MPGVRNRDKALVSFWLHRTLLVAVDAAAKAQGVNRTDYILEALAAKLGCALDASGAPLATDLERLAVEQDETRKRTSGKRSSGLTAAEAPSGGAAGETSGIGEPGGPAKSGREIG